jgi:4-carboxymuconolactone decarboxylase
MDVAELRKRGLELRKEIFGEAPVEKRMAALGEFGGPLQDIINGYAYGDLWQRPGLSPRLRSLVMVAMMAAANRPNELRVHLNGAMKHGCSEEEIREILLLLALYCGIPASIEAHQVAHEVFAAAQAVP